jgi:hypothetical protein
LFGNLEGKMSNNTMKVVSILFACMIIGLPMGWILLSNEPPSAYYATESSQVQAALKATGLNLCDKTESTWNVTGALGGFTILVSSDCNAKETDSAVYIHTQNFDSVQNRDSAVRSIQRSINMNDINGGVYTFGSYVIAVQGQAGGKPVTETVARVKTGLRK